MRSNYLGFNFLYNYTVIYIYIYIFVQNNFFLGFDFSINWGAEHFQKYTGGTNFFILTTKTFCRTG